MPPIDMKKKKIHPFKRRKKCWKCGRLCANAGARATHMIKSHPEPVPPPRPPEPPKSHRNFADLVRRSVHSWGREMSDEGAKHPSIEELTLGAIFVLIEEVRGLREDLARPQKITRS